MLGAGGLRQDGHRAAEGQWPSSHGITVGVDGKEEKVVCGARWEGERKGRGKNVSAVGAG